MLILIASPLQQWLHEDSTMLCYTYIACLVLSNKTNPFHFAIFKTCLDFDQSAGSRRLGWGHRAKGRGVINSSLYSHMIKRQRLQYFEVFLSGNL